MVGREARLKTRRESRSPKGKKMSTTVPETATTIEVRSQTRYHCATHPSQIGASCRIN